MTPLNPQTLAVANSLQLWAIPPGKKPRSLGLVAVQKPTELALNSMTLAQGMTIAISLEPAGGSPTGLPTGPVLYSGFDLIDIFGDDVFADDDHRFYDHTEVINDR